VEVFAYRGAEWHRFSQATAAGSKAFLYDGDNVVADIASGVDAFYVTPFLDQNLSITTGGSTYYYSQDGLGSVRTLTDSTGTVKNTYDYLPFGGAHQPGTSVTVEQRYTYSGRELNPESALMYYRYRQYDSRVGRFGGRDPVGSPMPIPHGAAASIGVELPGQAKLAACSPYDYVRSRPTGLGDAFGLWSSGDHRKITVASCKKHGVCIKKCCDEIAQANVDTDWPGYYLNNMHAHFNRATDESYDDARAGWREFMMGKLQLACDLARRGECKPAMREFGYALHAIQDRWPHSLQAKGEKPTSWTYVGWNEHDAEDADNANTARGKRAMTNSKVDSDRAMAWFKENCIGCCCDFPRVFGQPTGTKSLCAKGANKKATACSAEQ
jgi:RHS repeat-associated protein